MLSIFIAEAENNQSKPLTLEKLDDQIKTLQNGIESLKVLFTQVLERVNVVNEENQFLRCMLIQQQTSKFLKQNNQKFNIMISLVYLILINSSIE